MARRTRPPSRRRGLVTFGEAPAIHHLTGPDSALMGLARRMRFAEQGLHEATDELAQAEQRLRSLPVAERQPRPPDWFLAAQERESAAGDALEALYQLIATTSAQTNIGLGLKVQLIATLYGESIHDEENDNDLILVLLQSLLTDLSPG